MIEFQKNAVNEAADEYAKIELPKEYRQLMENISRFMVPYLGMNDGAIRGFISRAIVMWQKENNKKIAEVLSMPIIQRQQMMQEGMKLLKGILGNVLKTPSDQEKLNEAIDKGYKAYLKEFMPNIPRK